MTKKPFEPVIDGLQAQHVVALLEHFRVKAPNLINALLTTQIAVDPREAGVVDHQLITSADGSLTPLALINSLLRPTGNLVCSVWIDQDGFTTLERFKITPVADVEFQEREAHDASSDDGPTSAG